MKKSSHTCPAWMLLSMGVLVSLSMFGSTSHARAAMAVIDNSNLAQAAATASRAAEMVTKLESLKDLQTKLLDSMGLTGAFELSKDLEGVLQPLKDGRSVVGSILRDANAVRSDISSITRLTGSIEGLATSGRNVDDLRSAIRFVNKTIAMTDRASSTGERVMDKLPPAQQVLVLSARAQFSEQSAADAVGTALYHRETLDDSAKNFDDVRSAASAADDLQERVSVNTAAVIAVGEELVAIRGLLATMVQQQGAEAFGSRAPEGWLGSGSSGATTPPPQSQSQTLGNEVFR